MTNHEQREHLPVTPVILHKIRVYHSGSHTSGGYEDVVGGELLFVLLCI